MSLEHPPSLADLAARDGSFVLTIGSFDGVHRGHQALLAKLTASAETLNAQSWVVTFDPLPTEVLRPGDPVLIQDLDARSRALQDFGVDLVSVLPFDGKLAQVAPRTFVSELTKSRRVVSMCVGEDFRFGHLRGGDVGLLQQIGREQSFEVNVLPRIGAPSVDWSSSHVRQLLHLGNIEGANSVLGRPFQLAGKVIHGSGRGRQLGYPTANLLVDPRRVLPIEGIYGGHSTIEGYATPFLAAISVGRSPHFGENPLSVEAHILSFDADIYDRSVSLEFLYRLREERVFSTVEELIRQIGRDVAVIKQRGWCPSDAS